MLKRENNAHEIGSKACCGRAAGIAAVAPRSSKPCKTRQKRATTEAPFLVMFLPAETRGLQAESPFAAQINYKL